MAKIIFNKQLFSLICIVLAIEFVTSCKNTNGIEKINSSEFVPDSALFAKERPSPSIVRGFMMPEMNDQKNFNDAKIWGANVVRIQLHPARYATGKGQDMWKALPSYLDQLEEQVKAAKQAGLKVVIDLHNPPFQNIKFQEPELWQRTDLEEKFCRIWTDIATRFLPYKNTIWGYDIYNEPEDNSQYPDAPRQWRPLASQIIKAIRKIDKDTWIIFEPGPWGNPSGFKGLKPLPDPRVIYSIHFYLPQASFTNQGVNQKLIIQSYPAMINGVLWDKERLALELKYVDEFQARWKVPIYVGEFSVVRWAPKDAAVRWLQDVIDLFEARGWSWSYHAFREWQGWSLEYDEEFWMEGMPAPQPVTYETERAKVIRSAFRKN